MHFQEASHPEAKLIRCTRGRIFDVMIDLRPESPTHRQWFGLELSSREPPGALPARANDLPLVVGSNQRLTALGFKQQLDLEARLAQTIEWWRVAARKESSSHE